MCFTCLGCKFIKFTKMLGQEVYWCAIEDKIVHEDEEQCKYFELREDLIFIPILPTEINTLDDILERDDK